jgi:hypothetical protein
MSNSIKNNRITIYFSPRKDKDLITDIEEIELGDVGWFIKELMRDGIKYRNGGNALTHNKISIVEQSFPAPSSTHVGATFDELMDVNTVKRELSNNEAEEMFDKL